MNSIVKDKQATLAGQVKAAIVHNPHLNQRKLHFTTSGGNVRLEGQVESYFEKQMAQEAVRSIAGVDSIDNAVEVRPS